MYNAPFYITQPEWNNEFSYKKRGILWSKKEIYVPPMIKWTVNDLEIWTKTSFEEVLNNKLHSCVWLKNFIHTSYEWIPIYIFDNHNHALFFRYTHINQSKSNKELFKPFKVIHIDQHSDIKPNPNKLNINNTTSHQVFEFTNYKCNVGNFLTSAKESWLIEDIIQIRTDTALHSIEKLDFENYNYILDIDIDFREDKNIENDIQIIKNLIKNSAIVTIATSPYFLDQNLAIENTKKLFL